MLIGVQLPITDENVRELSPHNLLEAHDQFLALSLRYDTLNGDDKKQYLICRNEILRRLIEND